MKVILCVILVLVVGMLLLFSYLKHRPAAPTSYQSQVVTGGAIEATYMANGPEAVAVHEEAVLQGFGKYILYYPTRLVESPEPFPVIVLCNGTGTPLSRYPAVAKHLASWGFVVIGTEEEYDWNGFAAEMCIRYLERLRDNAAIDNKENQFYQKLDLDSVGILGHSQGGVGVINAMTTQNHGSIYKAAVVLSPTNKELATALQWDYDATQVNAPILLGSGAGSSGAGGGDDWVVTGEQLADIYKDVPGTKVMFRRKDTSHSEMLYSANGYVVAWFRYYLTGDTEAGKAFVGDTEIATNPQYQDVKYAVPE